MIDKVCRTREHLKLRPNPAELKIAIGVAVPAIEAWLLSGRDHEVGEARWLQGITSNALPFTKRNLKHKLYGSDRVSLAESTRIAEQEANRLANDLDRLKTEFPIGFGW